MCLELYVRMTVADGREPIHKSAHVLVGIQCALVGAVLGVTWNERKVTVLDVDPCWRPSTGPKMLDESIDELDGLVLDEVDTLSESHGSLLGSMRHD